jgi:hypothetical protein
MISAQKSEIKLAKRIVMGSLRNAGYIILKQAEYELAHAERDSEAIVDALATIPSFKLAPASRPLNLVLADDRYGARDEHHWPVITCDACGTVIDFDLTVKQK